MRGLHEQTVGGSAGAPVGRKVGSLPSAQRLRRAAESAVRPARGPGQEVDGPLAGPRAACSNEANRCFRLWKDSGSAGPVYQGLSLWKLVAATVLPDYPPCAWRTPVGRTTGAPPGGSQSVYKPSV